MKSDRRRPHPIGLPIDDEQYFPTSLLKPKKASAEPIAKPIKGIISFSKDNVNASKWVPDVVHPTIDKTTIDIAAIDTAPQFMRRNISRSSLHAALQANNGDFTNNQRKRSSDHLNISPPTVYESLIDKGTTPIMTPSSPASSSDEEFCPCINRFVDIAMSFLSHRELDATKNKSFVTRIIDERISKAEQGNEQGI